MRHTITLEEFARSLAPLIERICRQGDELVIEADGKPIGAIISIHQYQILLEERERAGRRLDEFVEANRRRNADVRPEEIEAAVLQAVREVRGKKPRQRPQQ